ncbi:MAG: hypothetical protein SCH98_02335 [Deferrisomatales bacterium]|nr:hypothetical protein [Deferrisomatales bacterium]
MKNPMIRQDADTFVALGQAVSLATLEGALGRGDTRELNAALVAGILSGCMELDTYARVHDALARLLERTFAEPPGARSDIRAGEGAVQDGDDRLGVYLEVVGDAWEKVSWEGEACGRLKEFVERAFDLSRARFGEGAWFRAPLRGTVESVSREARAAGLLVVSVQGTPPTGELEATLETADAPAGPARVVLGWGDRRTALDLHSCATA